MGFPKIKSREGLRKNVKWGKGGGSQRSADRPPQGFYYHRPSHISEFIVRLEKRGKIGQANISEEEKIIKIQGKIFFYSHFIEDLSHF